jgi:hypothetical protein
MFGQMNQTRSNIILNVISLVYFMRGSIQYESMLNLSFYERQVISDFISKRLDSESEKMHPVY